MRLLSAFVATATIASPMQAGQTSLVVSPDGPITTLEAARQQVQKLKKEHPGQPIEVLIKGGAYALTETVVFGLDDSGTKDAPITYKASPGEEPVFSGGVPITGWKQLSTDPEGVAKKAKGKLWAAPVPEGYDKSWSIKSLYNGETLLKRSQSKGFKYADVEKEADHNRQGKKLTSTLKYEGKPVGSFDRTIHFRDEDIKDWKNPSDIELVLKEKEASVPAEPDAGPPKHSKAVAARCRRQNKSILASGTKVAAV